MLAGKVLPRKHIANMALFLGAGCVAMCSGANFYVDGGWVNDWVFERNTFVPKKNGPGKLKFNPKCLVGKSRESILFNRKLDEKRKALPETTYFDGLPALGFVIHVR